eukprot:PRCOL_00000386-RA
MAAPLRAASARRRRGCHTHAARLAAVRARVGVSPLRGQAEEVGVLVGAPVPSPRRPAAAGAGAGAALGTQRRRSRAPVLGQHAAPHGA